MGVQVGLVGERADLAVDVAALAARAGACVVSLSLSDVPAAVRGDLPGGRLDAVVVDVRAAGGAQGALGGVPDWRGAGQRSREDPLSGHPEVVGPADTRAWAGQGPGQGAPLVVLCRPGEGDWARDVGVSVGAAHVVELPLGASWLESQLAPKCGSNVLAVVGAVGGVGASTVAIACAHGAGSECLLVDADPESAGLDLPLGIPQGAGVGWSDIPDTGEPLDPGSVRSALPRVGDAFVVTGSGGSTGGAGGPPPAHGPGRVTGVLGVGRAEFRRTVVDGGRGRLPAGLLAPEDRVALVLPATLAGVVAGRRLLGCLAAHEVVVLLRPSRWLPADEVAAQLGVPAPLEVPHLRRAAELADCGDLLSGRTGRALRRLGEQVWGQLT